MLQRFLVLTLLLSVSASAQTVAPPAPKAPSPPDERPPRATPPHAHYHPHPHPTTLDASRFTTNRESSVELPLPEEKDAFVFAVFGDRTGGHPEGIEVLEQAVEDTNLYEPDLVMTVGDLIQGYNETESWMAQMAEYKSVMNKLLCPWFPVAGNHDIYWRGPDRPEGEHEQSYEMHFGPLWYAFEHKDCWFIVLYSDEGDPETGVKNFNLPQCQKMSDEQFGWLEGALEQAQDAKHVFLFLHHPRWLGRNYGEDWERVHEALVKAGNVRAVFAGHIHRMRYDGPKDGIEYVTLATVGGHQSGISEAAGFLHHFHLVTVRPQQIAMASVPVGETMSVREVTGTISDEINRLAQQPPQFLTRPAVNAEGEANEPLVVELFNPTTRPVEFELLVDSSDQRWAVAPDHRHVKVHPGERARQAFQLRRMETLVDDTYDFPELVVNADYLGETSRFGLAERRIPIPVRLQIPVPTEDVVNRAAKISDGNAFAVDSTSLDLPDGPLTLEAWFRANSYGQRTGLIAKTQNSDYGIFVSGGLPYFSINLEGRYVEPQPDEPLLDVGVWHH
ncbi:MAG: metallophosphoesterase, partial [Planctomycetota bacterium]